MNLILTTSQTEKLVGFASHVAVDSLQKSNGIAKMTSMTRSATKKKTLTTNMTKTNVTLALRKIFANVKRKTKTIRIKMTKIATRIMDTTTIIALAAVAKEDAIAADALEFSVAKTKKAAIKGCLYILLCLNTQIFGCFLFSIFDLGYFRVFIFIFAI